MTDEQEREARLIDNIIADLGDDFTPERFKERLREAHANEPKPDLVYEMDEE
jgi:hypothetical protein